MAGLRVFESSCQFSRSGMTDSIPVASTSSTLESTASLAASLPAPISVSARKYAIYRPTDVSAPLPELPDSYFEPSVGELARVHAGQVAKRERYEGPLLTRKLREEAAGKEAAARRARFPNTRIRVKFADRTQLETALPSTSRLFEVYEAICEALAEEHRTASFMLYQPPRREFPADDPKLKHQSLYDLQLAPSSVLYIRFADDKLNAPSTGPPLRSDLLESIQDMPAPPSFDETALQQDQQSKEQKKGSTEEVARTKSGTALPKWLKTGKSGHK